MSVLKDHVTRHDTGAYAIAAFWHKGEPVFALGDGTLFKASDASRIVMHDNAGILVAASNGAAIFTGGDDGRVCRYDGAVKELAREKGWIDALAVSTNGAFAYSCAAQVTAFDAKGKRHHVQAPSSVRGLAFAPKGYRLALAHYGGASLWYPKLETPPERLDWKGSHLDALWSPDGRFVITTMQEHALHGWRLKPDASHMRMTGYRGKIRSTDWSPDGKWLATGGADGAILWPFESIEGPMGKAPRQCAVRQALVTRVAFHPKAPVLGIGYEDGCVLLVRLVDMAELPVQMEGGLITAMAWDETGKKLAFGDASGAVSVLALPEAG